MKNIFTFEELKELLIESVVDPKTFECLADLSEEVESMEFTPMQAAILRSLTARACSAYDKR